MLVGVKDEVGLGERNVTKAALAYHAALKKEFREDGPRAIRPRRTRVSKEDEDLASRFNARDQAIVDTRGLSESELERQREFDNLRRRLRYHCQEGVRQRELAVAAARAHYSASDADGHV